MWIERLSKAATLCVEVREYAAIHSYCTAAAAQEQSAGERNLSKECLVSIWGANKPRTRCVPTAQTFLVRVVHQPPFLCTQSWKHQAQLLAIIPVNNAAFSKDFFPKRVGDKWWNIRRKNSIWTCSIVNWGFPLKNAWFWMKSKGVLPLRSSSDIKWRKELLSELTGTCQFLWYPSSYGDFDEPKTEATQSL